MNIEQIAKHNTSMVLLWLLNQPVSDQLLDVHRESVERLDLLELPDLLDPL